MTKSILFSLFIFYTLGVMLLPVGDFSTLPDLPAMYTHCQQTEDRDMTAFEFVTEHLTGIGQLVSGITHQNYLDEPGDKPHTPVQFNFQIQLVVCNISFVTLPAIKHVVNTRPVASLYKSLYLTGYISKTFRPPVA